MVRAQSGTTTSLEPLASKHFTWPNIPYQVTGDEGGIRGPQFGYNLCNSTTENQQSLCQTSFLNSLDDFCMWSSSQTDDTIGESEAREVAWCTKPGHGTRVLPPGTLQGAQFLYAKNYLQVVGFLDQTKVGLDPTDEGGELDPHGADEQGNPLGGIVFTNGFGQNSASYQSQFKAGGNGSQTFTQVIEWIDFIGGGIFCLKMCNPSDPNAAELCQHVYDEIGCNWNALADYGSINGTFSVCDSDDMTPPGVFTAPNGQLTTWFQPLNGPITTIPYTTTIPSSSNCVTYQSTDLYAAAASAFPTTTSGSSTATTTSGASSSTGTAKSGSSSSGATSRTGSSTSSQPTNTSSSGALSINSAPLAVGALTGLALIMSIFA
ncbi:hypothetical protein SISSUDRAFT_992597 [Sistotremastrum suecicum HHB10207 ss-3]|nr:hypothetical protein SISSUDRAFT_992597 [Sistotremastrum suecicum HHB10207 ss-3]